MTPLGEVLPAVTCTAQSTMLTGTLPREHGIVGNGWYFRELAEVWLWRQSNRLVAGEKVWEAARRRLPGFTCAKLFWWYNMHSSADWSVTPRPTYPADGRKIPGIYCQPPDLAHEIERELGPFPLFQFWGPGAGLTSSRWIADCARLVIDRKRPTLTLVYLPHLDYDHQRYGPDDPRSRAALRAVDGLVGDLAGHARRAGAQVLVVSEYGIRHVRKAVDINRALRRAAELERLDGVADVLDAKGKEAVGLDHPRAGELMAVAAPDAWFTYYYWLDDARAPDFAPTVDIHRKPGYDPAELFLAGGQRTKLRLAYRLLQKTLGFRYVMDVIPLHGGWVRGSHGRRSADPAHGPVLIGSAHALRPAKPPEMTDVFGLILAHLER